MNTIQTLQFRDEIKRLFPFIDERALRSIVEREARRVVVAHLSPTSFTALAIAAVAGYIRHNMTHYDQLLTDGRHTRYLAAQRVRPLVASVESEWGRR